jgi:VanZ family protein
MLRTRLDPRVRALLVVGLAVYVLVLAVIAFWPTHVDRDAGPLLAAIEQLFPWATHRRLEFSANIALFVPFGLLLTPLLRSWLLTLILGVGASMAIEVVQDLALPGRTASALDVAANSLGTAVGVLLALLIVRATRGAPAPARTR